VGRGFFPGGSAKKRGKILQRCLKKKGKEFTGGKEVPKTSLSLCFGKGDAMPGKDGGGNREGISQATNTREKGER